MSDLSEEIRKALERYEKAKNAEEISFARFAIELKEIEWLCWQQGEINRLTKERDNAFELAANHFRALEQVKKERDEFKSALTATE